MTSCSTKHQKRARNEPLETKRMQVLTPFLDTYAGSVECRSARKGNSDWSVGELPIRVVADEETAECG